MDIKIYEKPIMTKFVQIDGEEFDLHDLYRSLSEILETEENDHYGEYSLRDYQLHNKKITDKLVGMGLVKNYTGSRMANLYCIKDRERIEQLLHTLYELEEENTRDYT